MLQTTTSCWVSPTFPNHVTCHFRTSALESERREVVPGKRSDRSPQNSGWQSNAKIMQRLVKTQCKGQPNKASLSSRTIGPMHAAHYSAPLKLREALPVESHSALTTWRSVQGQVTELICQKSGCEPKRPCKSIGSKSTHTLTRFVPRSPPCAARARLHTHCHNRFKSE